MIQYTEKLTIRITKKQRETLDILESKGINISQFSRIALKEKIKKDWKTIKEKSLKSSSGCPF